MIESESGGPPGIPTDLIFNFQVIKVIADLWKYLQYIHCHENCN